MSLAHEHLRPEDVRVAARVCRDALTPVVERDWSVGAGELVWDAYETLDHTVDALGFYAAQLASRATEHLPFETVSIVSRRTRVPAASLLAAMEAMAAVLADVVTVAPPSTRAFHSWGMADPSGFMAMGCDEMLIHTDDIVQGFKLSFHPPEELCRRVVARLFPWAPRSEDPWSALRWANGRMALPSHDRLGPDWSWHCAPLEEWDGTIKRAT